MLSYCIFNRNLSDLDVHIIPILNPILISGPHGPVVPHDALPIYSRYGDTTSNQLKESASFMTQSFAFSFSMMLIS